jgi:hypothetical protein
VGHTSGIRAALLALSNAGFRRIPRGQRGTDAEIDALVHDLYGMTEGQIAMVHQRVRDPPPRGGATGCRSSKSDVSVAIR